MKFSFPSQHTIFMHDTPDKWMFNSAQRTLSHGCLRLRNPVRMAELVLAEDKGWDAAKIARADQERAAQQRGRDREADPHAHRLLHAVGGRRRGAQDLSATSTGTRSASRRRSSGKWDQIAKGRDHLAPVEPDMGLATKPQQTASKRELKSANDDFLGSFFGGFGN